MEKIKHLFNYKLSNTITINYTREKLNGAFIYSAIKPPHIISIRISKVLLQQNKKDRDTVLLCIAEEGLKLKELHTN